MKIPYSKIKFVVKNLNIDNKIDKDMYSTDNKVYSVVEGKIELNYTDSIKIKNFFSSYSDLSYSLYKSISNLIIEVCGLYEINREVNQYMVYGSFKEYLVKNNNTWYDYPGINVPCLYGLYNSSKNDVHVKIQNNSQEEDVLLAPGYILINKPTDLMNIKVKEDCDLIDIYIAPRYLLENNEPGVWLPI